MRGAGIPFYTPAGVGTQVADGGLPMRYDGQGGVAVASKPKESREFGGRLHVLEEATATDAALVRARSGDRHGNLVSRESAQNYNPLCAAAGRVRIAEVEEQVDHLDPARVHTPGIVLQRLVVVGVEDDKPIERRTVAAVEA